MLNASRAPVIAVDIPSGTDADAVGAQTGLVARADAIVTFTAARPAHVFSPLTSGSTLVAEIGSPSGSPSKCDAKRLKAVGKEAQCVLASKAKLSAKGEEDTPSFFRTGGRNTHTDGRGEYLFDGVDEGEYTLSVEHATRQMTFEAPTRVRAGENRLFFERVIHGEIYKARPDVMAVVHNHSPSLIPFCNSDTRLRPTGDGQEGQND
jgi:hypothetical protein